MSTDQDYIDDKKNEKDGSSNSDSSPCLLYTSPSPRD